MARWYSSFSNTTITSLVNKSHQRLTMNGNTTTLKNALISTRAALSAAFTAQINVANNNGTLGTVVPRDGFTRGGGTVSSSNLYTNTNAVWQSDPSIRPSSTTTPNPTPITVANSNVISPADAWSISETVYTDASTAVMDVLTNIANIGAGTGGGPYSRLGLDSYRTLASLYHDHELTFFAWDDFTPGKVSNVNAVILGGAGNYDITITWDKQFDNDLNGTIQINAQLERRGAGTARTLNVRPNAGPLTQYTWSITGLTTPGTYDLSVQLVQYDPVITTNGGEQTNYDQLGAIVIV